MLINSAATQAICSLGWVHKGGLWIFRLGDRSPRVVTLSDAKYLTAKQGKCDFFALVHHWDSDKLEISAHHHSEPQRQVSRISLLSTGFPGAPPRATLTGDRSVWQQLPRAYVAFAFGAFRLFRVDPEGDMSMLSFDWYNKGNYDKDSRGIIGVQEVPNSELLIVSIQRDSNPVVCDSGTGNEIRKLSLSRRSRDPGGNPDFLYRSSGNELWANDYDHIVKLDATTLDVIATRQLQKDTDGVRRFIGGFTFARNEHLCLVARPFSGDVVGLDCDSMQQTHPVELGRQPLQAGLLHDDTVVALDWRTGDFLSGKLERA